MFATMCVFNHRDAHETIVGPLGRPNPDQDYPAPGEGLERRPEGVAPAFSCNAWQSPGVKVLFPDFPTLRRDGWKPMLQGSAPIRS